MSPPIATPRARALGFGLKRVRQERGLGVRELARLTDLPPQNISTWESGKRVPKIEEVATILGALVVEPGERARLLELARNATEPNWLEQHAPPKLATFIQYEQTAAAMAEWAPALMPGLLQTPAYIKALFAMTALSQRDIDNRLMIRLARREVLTAREPLQYRAVLGESVLRQGIGGSRVMAEQLRHLLTMTQARNISVRIVPDGIGYHPGLYGPFVIFDFGDLPPIVHLEHYRGSGYVYDQNHLADYRAALESLCTLALGETDSHRLIQGMIAKLEG
ncbi:helix-turn-helix domain-containing protein [Amycolatopsis sp. NPDC051758]|uniref:helix-turn-helix domain-containing protein n=1 Tax=Amycolatopsis sp. NPDC051758 TaxID=3363935 RepID=UPI0037986F29